jgi:SAM-dependent methyltransferase
VRSADNSSDWQQYLLAYHDTHPGVTEKLLLRCSWHGRSPYDDIADTLREVTRSIDSPTIIDLGCGSAPLASILTSDMPSAHWYGLDRSPGELTWAARREPGRVVQADMTQLPLADSSADALVSTCAIMLVQPLGQALREAARVLRSGGSLIATAPWPTALQMKNLSPLARLAGGLRSTLRNPNDGALATWSEGARLNGGFAVSQVSDHHWSVPLRTPADVDDLMDSLYLPHHSTARIDRARRWLTRWAGSRRRFPISLRTWQLTLAGKS